MQSCMWSEPRKARYMYLISKLLSSHFLVESNLCSEPCTCNSFPVCLFYLYSFCKKYLNSFSCYEVQYLMMLAMILFKINQFSLFIFFFRKRDRFPQHIGRVFLMTIISHINISIKIHNYCIAAPGHDIMKRNKSVQWFAFEAGYTGRQTMSVT